MYRTGANQVLAVQVARLLAERRGEFAVLGLARSGEAVARLLRKSGLAVYASDAGNTPELHEAAARLGAEGVHVQVGGHDLVRIAAARLVVVSPGIPPDAPALRAARDARRPVVSEVEVALQLQPALRYIAITGTNGKTTTTALVGHLLRALGHDAADAGNIGTAVSELAMRTPPSTWAALELSSFQLHDTPGIRPTVGVLTTLSPDHLDRYPDVTSYYADKARLFANADRTSRWVVTADNNDALAMVRGVPGTVARFSTRNTETDAWLDRARGQLVVFGEPIAPRSALSLPGDHNVANALAALLAVIMADEAHATPAARATLGQALITFRALPHRLEPVADAHDVLWLNDSKATNVSSAQVAIAGMTRPTIMLLGGRHKGEPYTALIEPLRMTGKAVLAYGEAADLIVTDLRAPLEGVVPVEAMAGASFKDVVARAQALAVAGDVVLLSPACSSFDMFGNYVERGQMFAQLARDLA